MTESGPKEVAIKSVEDLKKEIDLEPELIKWIDVRLQTLISNEGVEEPFRLCHSLRIPLSNIKQKFPSITKRDHPVLRSICVKYIKAGWSRVFIDTDNSELVFQCFYLKGPLVPVSTKNVVPSNSGPK